MRDAAVGFQCPSCVKEGAKTTRSGRTAYGGLRPTDASRTSVAIIGINVAVWLAVLVTSQTSNSVVDQLWLLPSNMRHGVTFSNPSVAGGHYWQLLTSMFTHQAVWHIGFNMYALYILGPQLEQAIGRWRFVALYLLSGLVGSAAVYTLGDPNVPTLGASGAIFGLLGALLVMAYKVGGDVRGLLTLLAINAVITFTPGLHISWQAHVGGFVGGLLIGAVYVYSPRRSRTTYQVAGLVGVALLVLAAVVLRTAALT